MKFSIITVCYNSAKTIRRTFESVLNQNFTDFEYIVVDGASKDGTLDIIKEYEPKFNGRMRYVSEPDKGIYDAMNKGIRMAQGEIIGIINSDDFLEPNALNEIKKTAEENPCAGVIYGCVRILLPKGGADVVRRDHRNLNLMQILHPGCFVKKAFYDQYGVFDTEYSIAADYDFLLRLYIAGVNFQASDAIVSNFTLDGVSCRNPMKGELQEALVKRKNGQITLPKYLSLYLKAIAKSLFRQLVGQ